MPIPRAWAEPFRIPAPIPGENQSIKISGSTVKIKGLTHQANRAWINSRETPVQKDGSFYEEVVVPIGQTEIVVEVKGADGGVSRYSKIIQAKENQWFLAGIADGTANFVDADQGFDLQRDNASFDDGTRFNGKASYYFAGKLKGKYLVKSTLDTDKATQEKLFTNIDPDKYYPIYGDNSTVVYDSNSQGKFYLLVAWDKSGFTVGNYQTQAPGEEIKLAAYNRTLYGTKLHLETPGRTVYGDPKTVVTVFGAEANQLQGHSELQATGGSLYYLRHRNLIEGSERVRLEIRDKNTHLPLRSVLQAENADYEIKYDEGRILFRKPVLSVAASDTVISDSIQEGNEVYVVADYEYKSQDVFPVLLSDELDDLAGGGRVAHHLNDHLELGATYAQEERAFENHRVYGVDTTLKLGNFTRVQAEFAGTEADSAKSYFSYNGGYDYTEVAVENSKRDFADRVELHSSLGEFFGHGKEFLDLSGYYQHINQAFSPADSLFQAGTRKYGMELGHRLTPDDKLRFIFEDSALEKIDGVINPAARNDQAATRTQNWTAQWAHEWEKLIFYTEYRFQEGKNSLATAPNGGDADRSGSIVAEKVEYHLSPAASLFVGQQVGLDDSEDTISSAGVSRKLSADMAVNVQGAVGQDRNSVLAGLTRQTNPWTFEYIHYEISDSALDGRSSATSFGSNTRISGTAELRRENRFVVSDQRGVYNTNLTGLKNRLTPELEADITYDRREEDIRLDENLKGSTPRETTSASISYIKPDHWKASSKFEYRVDTGDDWQTLSDSQGELKLTPDWFLFGEYECSRGVDETRDISVSRIVKRAVGVAFRPVNFDWFNALFKWIHLQDNRPRDITSAEGGFLKQQSTYDEFAGEFAWDLPWHFQFVEKIAYRDEDFVAVDVNDIVETPQNLDAYLLIHRLNYHLTDRFDLAAEFRTLRLDGSDVNSLEHGPLVEFTFQIHKNIAIGAGYNFTSFRDDFRVLDKRKSKGVFVRLQGKY